MTDSKMPEQIWAWHWEVDRHRGQWSEDQEIVGEGAEYIRKDLAHPAPVADAELEADDSLCSRIGEVGNQIHNIACEHQEDNNLSERLSELRGELWSIAAALRARTAQPVGVSDDNLLIAAMLAIEEADASDRWFEHWKNRVAEWRDMEHCGDCTKVAATCSRCVYEDALTRLPAFKRILSALLPEGGA